MSKDASPISLHQASEFIRKFTDAGGNSTDLQNVIESRQNVIAPILVQRIRDFYMSVDLSKAMDLIDYITPNDLREHLDKVHSPSSAMMQELLVLGRVPFPVVTLQTRKRADYFLIPVGPFTLGELCANFERHIEVASSLTEENVNWGQKVSKAWRWVLFCKNVLPRSIGYSLSYHWDFARDEEVQIANEAEVLYCTLMWLLVKKERLFQNVLVTGGGYIKLPGSNPRYLCIGEFKRDRIRLVDAEVPDAGIGAATIIRPIDNP